MRDRVIAVAWWLIVAGVLLLAPLRLRDRLPDPLATHWGSLGSVPDGSSSFIGFVIFTQVAWAVLWLVFFVLGNARGKQVRQRRMTSWGCLVGVGVVLLGAGLSTLSANLDVTGWQDALLPGWHIPLVIAAAIAAGGLAAYLGRGAPDEPSPEGQAPPMLRLRAGQRAVWVSRVVNRWLLVAVALGMVITVVTAALGLSGTVPGVAVTAILPGFVILFVAGLASVAVTVRVGADRIVIGFGPFGWPARRIRLSKVETAWAEERQPASHGGWGFRGMPGAATIMLRGGECLVLRYRSGGQLAISIDDAERGASLINALIAERVNS
ncbi:hypothetical protein AB0I81_21525 [Nonomuraea sp. NPDC050404]|uniref:hypothetical protein n=1 Tax=Nonomuraea sp. NPDC050404 TaxID=3155783 RepID=UPI0034035AF5